MQITREELVAAFTKWRQDWFDGPEGQKADYLNYWEWRTPNEFGEASADTLLRYLNLG